MTQTYPIKSRRDDERLVREWGFKHVFTWTDGRYCRLIHLHLLFIFEMSILRSRLLILGIATLTAPHIVIAA